MLCTIKFKFAHTYGTCMCVGYCHSNNNMKCPGLKLILTFLNIKLQCTNTYVFFIIKFYFMWRKKKYKRTPQRRSFRISEPIFDNVWTTTHTLPLNFDKTYFSQFRPQNSYEINTKISCDNKLIKETKNTKFLGLDMDSSSSRKDHIYQMMLKLVQHAIQLDMLNILCPWIH
jgi:hypothetical protein